MTWRVGVRPLSERSLTENSIAPETEVREARRVGFSASAPAKAMALSGLSITVHGKSTCWSAAPAHSM